jgi:putative resolvase
VVVILNRDYDSSPEKDLVQDVLEIITVFSARLYGLRSHQNKALIDELDKTTTKIGKTYGITPESMM